MEDIAKMVCVNGYICYLKQTGEDFFGACACICPFTGQRSPKVLAKALFCSHARSDLFCVICYPVMAGSALMEQAPCLLGILE